MNDNHSETSEPQAAAFQKLWAECVTKSIQAGMAFAAMPPTPDLLRQIRSDVFQSLAESWENFMRSPQFLDTMKQMMEQTIAMRKAANEFVGKARHEMQAPSREDLDAVMLFVRHMEKRLLDRLDDLSTQVDRLSRQAPAKPSARAKGAPPDSVKKPARSKEKAARL